MTERLVVPHRSGSKAPHCITHPPQMCICAFKLCLHALYAESPENSLKYVFSQR